MPPTIKNITPPRRLLGRRAKTAATNTIAHNKTANSTMTYSASDVAGAEKPANS